MNNVEGENFERDQTLSVMVVDDDPAMRNSVRRVLLLDGYHVELAGSAQELLSHPDLGKFFAILLDRRLPDGDASDLVEEIRANSPSAAILIITGYADMDHTIASIRQGIDDYLVKPVEPETLRMRLNSLAELYRIKRQMRFTQQKLVQSERLAAIGQMVAGLAHESRNALQRARSCLDLLELDLQCQSEQLDLTRRIREALNDLQRNYEEVRNYAAPIVLQVKPIDLTALVKRAFQDLRHEFPESEHRLLVHGATSTSMIEADEYRMVQVFRNILENAMDASESDGVIEVDFQHREVDGHSYKEIAIRDSGKGMDKETLAKLFEPFFTTKQSGTGLGMAICKRIVDAHGGKMIARSELGSGTTISLLLPVQHKQTQTSEYQ